MNAQRPEERTHLDPRTEKLLMLIAVCVVSLVAFEAIAVGTAMPTVAERLDGRRLYALAMGIPLAAQLVTTALAGLWCDAKGGRSCLYLGIALFSLGLVTCSLAPDMGIFVAGRAVQGLGGGMCIVPLYAMVGSFVHPSRQAAHFAALAAAWVLPSLVGPGIAGFLVERTTWRLVFGSVPLLLAVSFPLVFAGTRRIPGAKGGRPLTGATRILLPAAGAGIAVAALQALSGTDHGRFATWTHAAIVVAIGTTYVCVKPLLPHGTFASAPGLPSTVLVRGIVNGTFIGVEAFLPLLLQEVHGWAPLPAGLILTVGSVTWALGSWILGRIVSPVAKDRIPVVAALIQLAGIGLVIPGAFEAISPWVVVLGWTLAGLGTGLIFPAMSVLALALTPKEKHGATSSAIQLADTLGAAFCVAIAGIVYALVMPAREEAFAATIAVLTAVLALAVVVARRVRPQPGSSEEARLRSRTGAILDEPFADGMLGVDVFPGLPPLGGDVCLEDREPVPFRESRRRPACEELA